MSLKRDLNTGTTSSTSESITILQMLLTIIAEQTNVIFELTCCKLKAEMAAVEVEAKLRRESIVKESKARVAAAMASVTAITMAAPARRITMEE